jgi:DNA-binding MurR/RpiR family transcriptional regulator
MQLLQMLEEAERHVVLAFSYSGETRETVEALRVARGAGARTIVVTAFSASSIVGEAEIVLQVPVVNPRRYRVGLVDAVLPNLMILDILAILIGSRRDVETIRERVEDTIKLRKLSLRNNRPEGDGR